MFVVVSGCADSELTCHGRGHILNLYCERFLFFLATDEACLPSAVRTDLGRCAIVRFFFAADAAFLMFFRAALFCFVEAISTLYIYLQEGHEKFG